MKKHLLQGILLSSIIIISYSCSRRVIDFTIISSKNVPIANQGGNLQKATKRVKGIDSKWSILFIPGIPDMKEAIDDAIEQYPGAVALTDGVIYNKGWSCFLFGQNKYIVEGNPLFVNSGNSNLEYKHSPYNESETVSSQHLPISAIPAKNYQKDSSSLQDSIIKVEHLIEQEEKMSEIALLYNVTIPDILKWNKLSSIKVYKGMKLIIYLNTNN